MNFIVIFGLILLLVGTNRSTIGSLLFDVVSRLFKSLAASDRRNLHSNDCNNRSDRVYACVHNACNTEDGFRESTKVGF